MWYHGGGGGGGGCRCCYFVWNLCDKRVYALRSDRISIYEIRSGVDRITFLTFPFSWSDSNEGCLWFGHVAACNRQMLNIAFTYFHPILWIFAYNSLSSWIAPLSFLLLLVGEKTHAISFINRNAQLSEEIPSFLLFIFISSALVFLRASFYFDFFLNPWNKKWDTWH